MHTDFLQNQKHKFMYILDILSKDYGLNKVLEFPTIEGFVKWREEHEHRKGKFTGIYELYGQIFMQLGTSRCCLYTESKDVVIKINYADQQENSCDKEIYLYQQACEAGVGECFAWILLLGEFRLTRNKSIKVYICPYCEIIKTDFTHYAPIFKANLQKQKYKTFFINHKIYQYHSLLFAQRFGYRITLFYVAEQFWGKEKTLKVLQFINHHHITDIHAKNWGVFGEALVITDYANTTSEEKYRPVELYEEL